MENHIFETSINSIMSHGKHMFKTACDMNIARICAYPLSKYSLPHCKCVLCCSAQFPRIHLPIPEQD